MYMWELHTVAPPPDHDCADSPNDDARCKKFSQNVRLRLQTLAYFLVEIRLDLMFTVTMLTCWFLVRNVSTVVQVIDTLTEASWCSEVKILWEQ